MEAGMPRAQIRDEKTYQALRREGNSEEKSARIANAAAGSSRTGGLFRHDSTTSHVRSCPSRDAGEGRVTPDTWPVL